MFWRDALGKLIKFNPRKNKGRSWTRAEDYGVPRPPKRPKKPRGSGRKSWGHAFARTRPVLLLIALITAYVVLGDPRLGEPPEFLQTDPEVISGTFTRCGPGRGEYCVIDGDTFKLGQRSIRVVGIDTAERKARCPQEAALAERSTDALMNWLNGGPFQMTARIDDPKDRYGRDVLIIKRITAAGTRDRLADYMVASGGARPYHGGWRYGWCD